MFWILTSHQHQVLPSHDWTLLEKKEEKFGTSFLTAELIFFHRAACPGVRTEILWGEWATGVLTTGRKFGSILGKSLEKVLTAFRRLGLWLPGFHSKWWLHGSELLLMMCLIFCHYKYPLLPIKKSSLLPSKKNYSYLPHKASNTEYKETLQLLLHGQWTLNVLSMDF